MSNLINIHPVREELFHMDRRTDMTKLIEAYCNSGNELKTSNRPIDQNHIENYTATVPPRLYIVQGGSNMTGTDCV
jgi:hypothetical protein